MNVRASFVNKRIERSAGLLVYRNYAHDRLWLLAQKWNNRWEFPKGKIEFDEAPLQTALRETREETGIEDLHIIEGFSRIIEYHYRFRGIPTDKTVTFYLALTHQDNSNTSHEHKTLAWLSREEVLARLTYPDIRVLLLDAEQYLQSSLPGGFSCPLEKKTRVE